MHLKRIQIHGFRTLREFDLELDPSLNVIVGNNETGKTTLLDAINLVLTCQVGGRNIQYGLDPYFFNLTAVREYFTARRADENTAPPEILIEA